MRDEDIWIEVYRQVDMLIDRGYIDPARRREVEHKLFENKKEGTEVPSEDDQ